MLFLLFSKTATTMMVGKHSLARSTQVSPEISKYEEDASITQAILEALVPVSDPTNSIANTRSTHAHATEN